MLRSVDNTAKRAGSQRSLPLPSNACVSFSLNWEREKGRAEGMLGYAERTISHLLISSGSPHAHMQNTPSPSTLGLVLHRVPATRPDGQTYPYHTLTGPFSCSEDMLYHIFKHQFVTSYTKV